MSLRQVVSGEFLLLLKPASFSAAFHGLNDNVSLVLDKRRG